MSSGLVGIWKFDETTGQIEYDESNSNNNGYLGSEVGSDKADSTWILSENNCVTDLDNSGDTGIGDLLNLLDAWGTCEWSCPADFNGDNTVDVSDLLLIISEWGKCRN